MDGTISSKQSGGTGYLVVQVTTANSAIPLAGAQVTISSAANGQDVLYELRTGADGKTPRVALTAPPRGNSEAPSDAPTFAPYHIAVSLLGYQGLEFQDVPIFDGITSVQPADLIPLAASGYPDGFQPYGTSLSE